MGFLKKIWKEISVFGLVFVIFIALFAYRQATHVELTTINKTKLVEKKRRVILVPRFCFLHPILLDL